MTIQVNPSFIAIMLSLLMTACSTIETPGVVPPDAKALSAIELRDLIAKAIGNKRVFDDSYDGGLTFSFHSEGGLAVTSRFVRFKNLTGRWRIDASSDLLCTRIETEPESCSRVYQLSTVPERFYIATAGGSQRANTFVMR